ncbi:virB8 family protein [Rubellimicrobium aerolatum]|uniref:VirB8 family protein n=1 Tax=Rubellimicrobium aerolatum TaxID=490979 RepID=A0ABW0SE10_9RHOB|nr:type IV secretion system protein [Rubellimicrobium aerolatum]MBP1806986.1 type IV secretion system protein VirB8 [Rubellimicrobium aerolatum]
MTRMNDIVEEELIFGARRRERVWKALAGAGLLFGVAGCLAAAAVAVLDVDPAPALVAYDPATGMALPEARVGTVTLTERQAVVEAEVFRYVSDRETYNQLDNDLRVRRTLAMSEGAAADTLRALWTSGHDAYPPEAYGPNARIDVEVLSIALITNDRAQVRLRKRLTAPEGVTTGLFTATLKFAFHPETQRQIDGVWTNPLGFTVEDYAIVSDRLEE